MIRELVVVSGKGGTGKTSITAAFAGLAGNSVLGDADVDAADLHLLMAPDVQKRTDFMGGCKAIIRAEVCTACGKCRELCRFAAISEDFVVDEISCEGCGVCVDLCPEQAIDFPVQKCGEWFLSATRFGPMVHARLGIAQENSGKLVSLVRRETRKMAEEKGFNLILTDGPPGIGCPVIAAIGGATALAIVVEPTVSGLHDMQRVADLAAHFRVPGLVCINKFDLNRQMSGRIEEYTAARKMRLVGHIPFDQVFTRAMIAGQSVLEYDPDSPAAQAITKVWQEILRSPAMNPLGIKDFTAIIQ